MRGFGGIWDSSCPPSTRDSRGGGPARRGKASCWRPPEVSRSPTASLGTAQAFWGKKGIFRLRPAEVPGCLSTSSRAAPSTPGRCRCLHPPAPPGSSPCATPGDICSAPPALSITAQRPQAFGTPGDSYGTPGSWYRSPWGFFLLRRLQRQSWGFARQKKQLPARQRAAAEGASPFPAHSVQRCVTTGAHSTDLTLHTSLGHYLSEVGGKIPRRDLEIHPPAWAGGVKARQGKMFPPQHGDSPPDRGLWGKAALKPATSELTLRKSH